MRNLKEYPITEDEKIEALSLAIASIYTHEACGDVSVAALEVVRDDVIRGLYLGVREKCAAIWRDDDHDQ